MLSAMQINRAIYMYLTKLRGLQIVNCFIHRAIQSNFNGSNTSGTMKISSRQG